MPKMTIIVGVAGSGKSHFCKRYAREHKAKAFLDGTLANKEEKRAGFDCLGEIVARLLGQNEDCVMDESHLCMEDFRNLFKEFCDEFLPEVEQEWIFFEKNTLACINNICHDYGKGRTSLSRLRALRGQSNDYTVPPRGEFPGSAQPVAVFDGYPPSFSGEEDAIQWVQETIDKLEAEGK
ncbi:MAG: hypothetical protein KF777_18500 [Planctomycetaceae bacterium]|jgi:hypothetical protein|nr:hypothetical protein [Planctomycetaceae bacterium]